MILKKASITELEKKKRFSDRQYFFFCGGWGMGRSTANQHFSGQPNFGVWIQDPKLLYGQALSFLQKIEGQCGFCNDGCLTEVSSAFFLLFNLMGDIDQNGMSP